LYRYLLGHKLVDERRRRNDIAPGRTTCCR